MTQEKEYIDRNALIDDLIHNRSFYPIIVKNAIKNAPVADVAPVVHARWEINPDDIYWGNTVKRKYCTACKKEPHFDREKREFILTAYCPNCGAKMD